MIAGVLLKDQKDYYRVQIALDLQITEIRNHFDAKCRLTDKCYYKLEIIKVSNNAIIQSINSSAYIGGETASLIINTSIFTDGAYKFKVSVLPYYNSQYGNYAVGWKSREIQFTPLKAPIISGFTQTPNPICMGSSGNVYCNLSQGNGSFVLQYYQHL